MELKNIFKMTKTDRYTQNGRDELAKLQETEDVKYKTGDISQKTGLQKQPDGSWAPPKNGAKAGKQSKSAEENKKTEYKLGDQLKLKNGKIVEFAGHTSNGKIRYTDKSGGTPITGAIEETEIDEVDNSSLSPREYAERMEESKPDATTGSGVPIKGSDWISLPSGTRMTIAGAREKYAKNKERIESLKKLMEGNTKAGNFRIGAELKRLENENEYLDEMLPPENKPAEKPETEPKHTLEVGSEVKFKKSGQPITIKKIENYGGTPIVVGEYDYNGKRETNRFRLDELDYEQKEERKDLVSGNTLEEGRTVNFKKTGQPIKIKKVEYYGSTPIIVGEYEHNGKTETNRFRMDEIETPDSAPRELTGDCKIRIRK